MAIYIVMGIILVIVGFKMIQIADDRMNDRRIFMPNEIFWRIFAVLTVMSVAALMFGIAVGIYIKSNI